MEKLEKLFNDISRIADAMEKRNQLLERLAPKETNTVETKVEQITQAIRQPQVLQPVAQPVPQPIQPVQQPAAIPNQIPTTQVVHKYTKDQFALAMGRALDAGKMADIQRIVGLFGVQTLMEIPEERYDELALKLKEIGVDV